MRSSTSLIIPFLLFMLQSDATKIAYPHRPDLVPRAYCRTQGVVTGDSCHSLAQKCGISDSDFTNYNSNPNTCSTLREGQQVCCSSGTLPSRKPSQNSDGSCYAYTVQAGDYCDKIAASYDLATSDLSTFNDKKTWGWSGCSNLMAKTSICLSTGNPPIPPADPNAVCGPTVSGTTNPWGLALSALNPCKLNACCDIWGQCGITPEFCTADTGPTGNPGTAPPGKNGCISNCGVTIANIQAPASQINVGYYESWNWDRSCLNMRVQDVDTSKYTHYHWAFADVSGTDFTLSINDTYNEWEIFKGLQGIKRIVSIGGWSFSTSPNTYNILRNAMTGDNSKKFAQNIVDFLNTHNLDGIDIDWEYPGAPDNQGVSSLPPTGSASDGPNYWLFLYNLRNIMPSGKTISIAAPASFWYLKAFPIGVMKDQVDYIVYMTYDLHGQWDYNNKWSQEGCPAGNCLRSHVNFTETAYALSMITKAGVPTNKIVVGISSYGRAFGMVNPKCDGPMCTYRGPASAATPGICTGTAGYIANAEINRIIAQGGSNVIRSWYDQATDSDYLVYGSASNGQWVAYMSDATRARRASDYKAYSFLGTADWAVDLLSFGQPRSNLPLPGNTQAQPGCKWDYTFAEIAKNFGKGGWDMNSVFRDICVFYIGPFRQAASDYVCLDKINGGNSIIMSDLFYPKGDPRSPFNKDQGPRYCAIKAGKEREWFRRLSEMFAEICEGETRVMWDGVEPFNKGDMANPVWHTQWDWYEWPILNSKPPSYSTRINKVDPKTFQKSPYSLPSDHSDPPAGDAPEHKKRSEMERSSVFLRRHPNGIEGNSTLLTERANPLTACTTDECKACSKQKMADSDNTEVVYSHFQDGSSYVEGYCGLHLRQRYEQDKSPTSGKISDVYYMTIKDNEGITIGGSGGDGSASFKVGTGDVSGMTSHLPYLILIDAQYKTTNPVTLEYAGFRWKSSDSNCKVGGFDGDIKNGHWRQMDCGFTC